MLLEVVVLCGTFSQDEACGGLLVQAGLLPLLIDCLKGEYQCHFPVIKLLHDELNFKVLRGASVGM